jgi:catechol 2,3-dioxygenase-like lactoylglutathione lyase family enzyme
MKPKISIVSLGVSDLGRALAFYRDGLGFPTHNYTPGDDYIMLALEGAWLSLVSREIGLTKDLPPGAQTFSSVGLSHNVPSTAEVDAVYALAISAGATPIAMPREAHWGGYEASFADPDGHVWDIAFNPFTDLT